jgi:hypothetical protein
MDINRLNEVIPTVPNRSIINQALSDDFRVGRAPECFPVTIETRISSDPY